MIPDLNPVLAATPMFGKVSLGTTKFSQLSPQASAHCRLDGLKTVRTVQISMLVN